MGELRLPVTQRERERCFFRINNREKNSILGTTITDCKGNNFRSNHEPTISALQINICSLANKIGDLEVTLSGLGYYPGFLVISEHWLKANVIEFFPVEGYSLKSYFCRENLTKGGVMILSKINIECVRLELLESLSIESHCGICAVSLPECRTAVVGVYRVPNGDLNVFCQQMERVLTFLDNFEEVILLGDFNIWFTENTYSTNTVNNLFRGFGYKFLIHEPTRGIISVLII